MKHIVLLMLTVVCISGCMPLGSEANMPAPTPTSQMQPLPSPQEPASPNT